MSAALIPVVAKLVGGFLDKAVPDVDQRERLKAEASAYVMEYSRAELESATKIIVAEAGGESWLQRNWRPIVMLWLAALVGAHWVGFTPENLDNEQVLALLKIVQIGLGGYVVGRSVEKSVKAYSDGNN